MRKCQNCKEIKKLSDFYVNNSRKDKLTTKCKVCFKEYFDKTYSPTKRKIHFELKKDKCDCGNNKCNTARRCMDCLTKDKKSGKIICGRPFQKGENHPNWNNGATKIRDNIEALKEYKLWRIRIFDRDSYTCQICRQKGGYLNSHHIKHLADIIKEYNIKSVQEALKCDILWDTENGVTVCDICHRHIHFN